jgi:hypothetical protein
MFARSIARHTLRALLLAHLTPNLLRAIHLFYSLADILLSTNFRIFNIFVSTNITHALNSNQLIHSRHAHIQLRGFLKTVRRGVADPFRERYAEEVRNISELKVCNKGGMIFWPEAGIVRDDTSYRFYPNFAR